MLRCAASAVQKGSECGGVSNKLSVAHCSSYAQVDTYAIISPPLLFASLDVSVRVCTRTHLQLSAVV